MNESDGNFTQIEDIIDARKKLGQYNVYKQENTRYTCSNNLGPSGNPTERYVRFDDTMLLNDSTSNLKLTDSEVTIVRVRCGGTAFKRRQSKWDMHDAAIPGDGSHLGESPSLVNLATLVPRNPSIGDEYLVPLSSWDPYYKPDSSKMDKTESDSTNKSDEKSMGRSEASSLNSDDSWMKSLKSLNLAGKISKFIRQHCQRKKTPQLYRGANRTEKNKQIKKLG